MCFAFPHSLYARLAVFFSTPSSHPPFLLILTQCRISGLLSTDVCFGVSDSHSLCGVSDPHTATLPLRSESKGRVLATEEVRTKSVALIPEGVEAAVRSPCPSQADGFGGHARSICFARPFPIKSRQDDANWEEVTT